MLKISNQMPGNSVIADDMYDKANITKGKLPNTGNNNAQNRLDEQILPIRLAPKATTCRVLPFS